MSTRGSSFAAVPNIMQTGMSPAQYILLNALKENVELLIGSRGDATRAVIRGQVTVRTVDTRSTNISAQGSGVNVSGTAVPSLEDYRKLLNDVKQLNQDIELLRSTLNLLISQIRT